MKTKMTLAAAAALIVLGAGAATAQDRYDWSGGRPGTAEYRLEGPGVRILYPELRDTGRGRAFVMRNFDFDRDGYVSPREAAAANRAFDRFAGRARDRFDWDARDRPVAILDRGPVRDDVRVGDHWDVEAMRSYGFRQTARGATMRLDEDVLFATDQAVLRPHAIDRLKALADYLRSEPGVRVAIDGYTDSRGSDAHNQALSERRAEAVRTAFDEMGVTHARFSVAGHGEADPVATNATAAGQRLNRRVEVTLLGQRADRFMR